MLQPLDYFHGLLWTRSSRSTSFLCWGPRSWTQHCRWVLTKAEKRGRIPFLDLLPTLLLMEPRKQVAFWAASACWASCQPIPSSLSLQGCSQSVNSPACICARDCPNPAAGPCTGLCWTSEGSQGPTSQPVKGPVDDMPSPYLTETQNLFSIHWTTANINAGR